MKLSARDLNILYGLLAVVIILLGIFLLIKPKAEEIKADDATLVTVKEEWDAIEVKKNAIEPLQKKIKDVYTDSKKISDGFIDVEKINYTYKLDQFLQPYLDQCNMVASSVELAEVGTSTLDYYYFTPVPLTSSMFDAADVNGENQAGIDAILEESNAISARTAETVISTRYGLAARGSREEIWSFMQAINDMKTTILIDSVDISDYTFGEDTPAGEENDGKSDVTFTISLYSVFEMDEPVVE